MRRRRRGEHFSVAFALSDPRAILARGLAHSLLDSIQDHDERIAAFDALAAGTLQVGEHAQTMLSPYSPNALATLRDVAKLGNAVVVRSTAEHERIARLLQFMPQGHLVAAQAACTVPECTQENDCVVLFAPEDGGLSLQLPQFALTELRRDVALVHAGESLNAFSRARVVLDTTLDHPGNAMHLAHRGYTVVAPITSGAYEYLDGCILYEPWNHRSIFAAVTLALGKPPTTVREEVLDQEAPRIDDLAFGPLASIIVRTHNRPEFLQRCLQSLASQRYRDLEIIVVNDGGVDVEDIVSSFERTHYVRREQSGGASVAANAGLAAANGEFVGFLDDDDIAFPDHVSALISALVRSGAEVAHSDTITAHYERNADGSYREVGYNVFLDGLVEPTDFYVTDGIGPMSVMAKRDLVLAAGGFDETLSYAEDWELYLKLSRHYEFVHVRRVTASYSLRRDQSQLMSRPGSALASSLERLMQLHPLPHRPSIENARRQSIERYIASGYEMRFPRPAMER